MPAPSPWTDDLDARLRDMWASGDVTAAIGIALDMSKNAVIGRARRLGLKSRGNPNLPLSIRQAGTAPRPNATRQPSAPKAPAPAAPKPRQALPPASGRACQWPSGDPRAPGFHFCGAPVAAGSYCRDHYRRAYVCAPATVEALAA